MFPKEEPEREENFEQNGITDKNETEGCQEGETPVVAQVLQRKSTWEVRCPDCYGVQYMQLPSYRRSNRV